MANSNNNSTFTFILRAAARVAQQQNINLDDLLNGTDLSPKILEDPYHTLSHTQERLFIKNFVKASDTPWLGLLIGNELKLTDFGAFGITLLTAKSSLETHAFVKKFGHFIFGNFYWERIFDGNISKNFVMDKEPLGDIRIAMLEVFIVAFSRLTNNLLNSELKPIEIQFDYAPPTYVDKYQKYLPCPLKFNQPHTCIAFPAVIEGISINTYDPTVYRAMSNLCQDLSHNANSLTDISQTVRHIIADRNHRYPSIEEVAESMNMSSRTLRRQLAEQGTKFQTILDSYKEELAKNKLTHSKLSIQQIAELCGFSDAKSFSHAFKRWTGMPPSEFRA